MTATEKHKLIELLTRYTNPQQLALFIRRYQAQTIRLVLEKEDDVYKKEWISEGNYWLTELCEALDPQLEKLM